MSAGHSSAMQRWMQSGKPLLQIPLRFADDERVEMLIQSRHPTWSRRTTLAAKQAILQMAYYRAQEGTFRGEIPPEMDENLEEVLEEVREHPRQPAVQPAVSDDEAWGTWRASSDPRRPVTPPSPADPWRPVTPPRRPVTPPKQPPRQKARSSPRRFCSHLCRCLRKRLHCRRLRKRPRWGYLYQHSRRCRLLRQRPRRTRGHQRRHRRSVQCTAPRRGKATE